MGEKLEAMWEGGRKERERGRRTADIIASDIHIIGKFTRNSEKGIDIAVHWPPEQSGYQADE